MTVGKKKLSTVAWLNTAPLTVIGHGKENAMTDYKELIERLRSVDADMNDEYGGGKGPSLFRETADALEADICAVVKPLVWKDGGNGRWAAWDGYFVIQFMTEPFQSLETGKPTRFCLMRVNADNRYFSRMEEAKAAAQADYEARILSAITIRPASEVWAEAHAAAIEAVKGVITEKCSDCAGTGKMDDADCGDIFFTIWPCSKCKATGRLPDHRLDTLHDADTTAAAIERIKEQARRGSAVNKRPTQ